MTATRLLIGNVRVSPDATEEEILKKASAKMKREGFLTSTLRFRLYKKSVDARRRDDIRLVCTVLAESDAPASAFPRERLTRADARILVEEPLTPDFGVEPIGGRPLVVGMGPAGLFAALLLARNGYAPILIDRGAPVEERVRDVEHFRATGRLNTESNVQFGAGGAGTFSDGKLNTGIKNIRCRAVLETFVEAGAPKEILIDAKPHIGTDILKGVVKNIRKEIINLGGEVRFGAKLEDINLNGDKISSITVNGEEIPLTVREFDILFKLLSFPKKTFTRSALMNEFWDYDSSATSRTVDVYMAKIREKTATCDGFEIATVHGLGYKVVLK